MDIELDADPVAESQNLYILARQVGDEEDGWREEEKWVGKCNSFIFYLSVWQCDIQYELSSKKPKKL
jgi:hypothetical protein